jgi:23S rRNA (cytidine2498-2'-O)-methyltransferase
MTRWIWTCRAGFEPDLVQELTRARVQAAALVTSEVRGHVWPVFARTGFPLVAEVTPAGAAAAVGEALAKTRGAWTLHAWVPDADATNTLSADAVKLGESVLASLPEAVRLRHVGGPRAGSAGRGGGAQAPPLIDGGDAVRYGGTVAQLCLVARDRVLFGLVPAQELPTLAPGGRARSRAPKTAPSRAARKLVEALEWFGRAPEAGEVCVDLGAAPGGWTAVLLERRARVIAVDPARLAPELRGKKGLAHVQASAFEFAPDEPVDWLFCDMAWRPLEVAALLAKWARRRWANTMLANIKLPMKQRVEFVRRVLSAVEQGGWRDLRARHLYHDRDEFTLGGWRT